MYVPERPCTQWRPIAYHRRGPESGLGPASSAASRPVASPSRYGVSSSSYVVLSSSQETSATPRLADVASHRSPTATSRTAPVSVS